ELGRQVLGTDPKNHKHYAAYTSDKDSTYPTAIVVQFPCWETDHSLLPIRVQPVHGIKPSSSGECFLDSYALDPASTPVGSYATVSSGIPKGLSATPSRTYYQTWSRKWQVASSGQQKREDRYHLIPTSGAGSLGTNFYRTTYLYDPLGRLGATAQY